MTLSQCRRATRWNPQMCTQTSANPMLFKCWLIVFPSFFSHSLPPDCLKNIKFILSYYNIHYAFSFFVKDDTTDRIKLECWIKKKGKSPKQTPVLQGWRDDQWLKVLIVLPGALGHFQDSQCSGAELSGTQFKGTWCFLLTSAGFCMHAVCIDKLGTHT